MKKEYKLFAKGDAKANYGVIAQIYLPTTATIKLSYTKLINEDSNYYYKRYTEYYTLMPQLNLYTINVINYIPKKSDYRISYNRTESENSNQNIKLYFGEDVTGKTNDISFQLLYNCKNKITDNFYDVEILYPDMFSGNLRFIIGNSSNFWDTQLICSAKLNIVEDNFLSIWSEENNDIEINDINKITPKLLKPNNMLGITKRSNTSILHISITDDYYLPNNCIATIIFNKDNKIVYYNGDFGKKLKFYFDNNYIYIKNIGTSNIYLQQLFTQYFFDYVYGVDESSLTELNFQSINDNENNTTTFISNIIPTKINGVLYWGENGAPRDSFGYPFVKRIGSLKDRPSLNNKFAGFNYLETSTENIKPIYFYNGKWYNALGVDVNFNTSGNSKTRPSTVNNGYLYYNYDTKSINAFISGINKWYNLYTIEEGVKNSGTFAEKPTSTQNIPIGFAYFCTDKQTAEGTTNGIMIYYKGNDIWVDALGIVVDNKYPIIIKGSTIQRPTLTSTNSGFEYYDTTLKKKLLWNGTAWVNMDGTSLTINNIGTTPSNNGVQNKHDSKVDNLTPLK